ncbi:hypothetical protein HYV81_05490 [Candidatus Woesearchaeota archaeon]|nr:hypothetical protein [Candidatus Woesearchaeota archaeon]
MDEVEIGKVTHFFDKAQVAVIGVQEDSLKLGDSIHVLGNSTNFNQKVASMQIEHKAVEQAEAGQEVAVKVEGKCHRNDTVFKVVE